MCVGETLRQRRRLCHKSTRGLRMRGRLCTKGTRLVRREQLADFNYFLMRPGPTSLFDETEALSAD
eukprot:9888-Pleurochrysis_carterae.AAC.1